MFNRIIYWLFYYSKVYNLMKPILVWAFIHFEGDQQKIYDFLDQRVKIDKKTLEHDLKGVNLNDYVSGIDFGKEKYFHIPNKVYVIVPKGEFKNVKRLWKETKTSNKNE